MIENHENSRNRTDLNIHGTTGCATTKGCPRYEGIHCDQKKVGVKCAYQIMREQDGEKDTTEKIPN